MKFLLLLCLVGITMAFPTPVSSIQQNNEALTAAKNSRPQRHVDSQEPLYYETYHNKRSAPEYRIHRREAPSYAPPRPTYKPVKPDYKASPPTQAPAPHIIYRREAPSYAPPRPTYKPKPTDKPVKPDYKAPPPTQAPAPHIIKRREAPSYVPPPPPIHIHQQPQVEQLKAAAPVYKPPAKPFYNPPAKQSY